MLHIYVVLKWLRQTPKGKSQNSFTSLSTIGIGIFGSNTVDYDSPTARVLLLFPLGTPVLSI